MATTRIFVTTDAALAATTAGFWENKPDQYKVVPIGPTDKIEVSAADQSAMHWASTGGPWYCVLVTKDAQ
jgi:hypothetical protein